MRELPDVVLFDLDDTLVSFSAGPRDFWREAFDAQDGSRLGTTCDAFLAAIGDAAVDYWREPARAARGRLDLFAARREVVRWACERLGVPPTERAAAIADSFTTLKEDAVVPFPGAVETLRALRGLGIRLGLVTNGHGSFQRRKLERHGLAGYFDAILIEGEHGVGKPDPSIFASALRRLGTSPQQACMVGDDLVADIAGAQRVGLRAIWNDHAGRGLPQEPAARPDRRIRCVAELV